jgi:hypothetical protein
VVHGGEIVDSADHLEGLAFEASLHNGYTIKLL